MPACHLTGLALRVHPDDGGDDDDGDGDDDGDAISKSAKDVKGKILSELSLKYGLRKSGFVTN